MYFVQILASLDLS